MLERNQFVGEVPEYNRPLLLPISKNRIFCHIFFNFSPAVDNWLTHLSLIQTGELANVNAAARQRDKNTDKNTAMSVLIWTSTEQIFNQQIMKLVNFLPGNNTARFKYCLKKIAHTISHSPHISISILVYFKFRKYVPFM